MLTIACCWNCLRDEDGAGEELLSFDERRMEIEVLGVVAADERGDAESATSRTIGA